MPLPPWLIGLAVTVLAIIALASTVWVLAPAFQGAEAARRDLGSHRLEFGAWLAALVVTAALALPLGLALHLGRELNAFTFAVSALATDIPLLLIVYVRLIMPGALTWSELGLKPVPLEYALRLGLAAGLGGLVVIDLVGTFLSQFGLRPNQLEQFRFVLTEGPGAFAILLIAAAVIAPFVEELFFRGFLFGVYRRRQPLWLVYLVSGVLFTVLHLDPNRMNPSQMAGLSVGIFLLALLLGWLYQHTGSLYPGMIAHAVNNATGLLLFYSFGVH